MMRMPRAIAFPMVALAIIVAVWAVLGMRPESPQEPAAGRPADHGELAGVAPLTAEGTTGLAAGGGPVERIPAVAADGATTKQLPGELVVTVKDWDRRDLPIADAQVSVIVEKEWVRLRTDVAGEARFRLPKPGRYWVHATAEGCEARDDSVVVEAGLEGSLTLELRKGVGFDGRVVAAADGRPIEGATVRYATISSSEPIEGATHHPEDFLVTGSDGRFRVPGMPEDGMTVLRADAPGFQRASTRVDADDIPPAGVLVRMHAGGGIAGTVRDRAGTAVADARVYAFLPAAPLRAWAVPSDDVLAARTRSDGSYLVEGVALDTEYTVRAQAPGYARSADIEHVIATARTPEVRADPVLRRPAAIVVHTVDPAGHPVPDTMVDVGDNRRRTDAQGMSRFEELPPGGYRVFTQSVLFREARTYVDMEEGQTVDIRLQLDPGARIEGRVLGVGDQPVAGARLEVEAAPGGPALGRPSFSVLTNAEGTFRIGGLLAGDYLLSAKSDAMRALPTLIRAPSADVTLRCNPLGKVRLRILVPDGTPYPDGINIGVTTVLGDRNHYVDSDADGRITLGGLDAGPITLDVHPFDWPALRISTVLGPGETLDLGDRRLAEGLPFSGIVRDAMGNPVVGASVYIGRYPGVKSDSEGRFTLRQLAPGDHSIHVASDDFIGATRRVHVSASADIATFVLERGGLLRGVVKDSQGELLARRTLHAEWAGPERAPDSASAWARSRSDGRVEWRLAPGRWSVTYRSEHSKDVRLGEWTVVEGVTLDADFTLPSK